MTCSPPVTPAKARVQKSRVRGIEIPPAAGLDSGFRRNDGVRLLPIGQNFRQGYRLRGWPVTKNAGPSLPLAAFPLLEQLRYNVSSPEQLEDIFGKQEEEPDESV